SQEYPLTAGPITNACAVASQMSLGNPVEGQQTIRNLLDAHMDSLGIRPARPHPTADSYVVDALNTDTPIERVTESIEVFARAKSAMPFGLNVLLYGPPGTGKTAYVSYLARRLG